MIGQAKATKIRLRTKHQSHRIHGEKNSEFYGIMSASPRTSVSMPRATFDRLQAIAERRGLSNANALIDAWIARAIDEGEIEPDLPGFTCQRCGANFLVSVKDSAVLTVPPHKARVLASVLAAAAGEPEAEFSFTMQPGKPVAIDLGDHTLVVARAGRSVRFVLKPRGGGEGTLSSVSYPYAIEMARLIRAEFPN